MTQSHPKGCFELTAEAVLSEADATFVERVCMRNVSGRHLAEVVYQGSSAAADWFAGEDYSYVGPSDRDGGQLWIETIRCPRGDGGWVGIIRDMSEL